MVPQLQLSATQMPPFRPQVPAQPQAPGYPQFQPQDPQAQVQPPLQPQVQPVFQAPVAQIPAAKNGQDAKIKKLQKELNLQKKKTTDMAKTMNDMKAEVAALKTQVDLMSRQGNGCRCRYRH